MKSVIKDIKAVGWKMTLGGLLFQSHFSCWIKRQTICRWNGHDTDGIECFKCWLYMKEN